MMYGDVIRTHETFVKLLILETRQFGLELLLQECKYTVRQ